MSLTFQNILSKYRKFSFSEVDKGRRFERLIRAYLLTDPVYASHLKKIWMWNDFPARRDFGGIDSGIDLVALTYGGDYWAIQCKCYQENAVIDKPAVDSFLSTSSREFKDEDFKRVRFSHRLWISTTNNWNQNATEAIRNQSPPVTRINLYDLQEAKVDWEKLEKEIYGDASRISRNKLLPHQIEALEKTHEYFKTSDRGKLIMACGTGKTFLSLKIAEKETDGKGLILFLVPSIALIGQALREWSNQAEEPIGAICVCSDTKVSSHKKYNNDDYDSYSIIDLAFPASTDINNIIRQLRYRLSIGKKGLTVIFSTYQ